ncbi:hypothetical protein F4860DRAFT_520714 [Xylaria cubensis]|nr:hypothetical protein F4860DRAFT_520714 [Xylaria cubensis]
MFTSIAMGVPFELQAQDPVNVGFGNRSKRSKKLTQVVWVEGKQRMPQYSVAGCQEDSGKIYCHGDEHDIVKHGYYSAQCSSELYTGSIGSGPETKFQGGF